MNFPHLQVDDAVRNLVWTGRKEACNVLTSAMEVTKDELFELGMKSGA